MIWLMRRAVAPKSHDALHRGLSNCILGLQLVIVGSLNQHGTF